ncbi:MAG TPA: hypothetical protein VEI03_02525 [Stellaceae bacterium]|nr:hypothetical protein [Stellaceae bacterium]
MFRAIFRVVAAAGTAVALVGCQVIGPSSISAGRDQYNAIIHSTSMDQTLANVVRVYNHEPTLFMDVTEVDAVPTFLGSVGGAATNIGANPGTSGGTIAGRVGSAVGALQYSETSTIRYVPLLGQALVQQLVTPVSVDVLAELTDSAWAPDSVLNFATYLTLDKDAFYPTLSTIAELYDKDFLQFVAGKSELTKEKPETPEKIAVAGSTIVQVETVQPKSGANDSLVLQLLPFHPHELDQKTQKPGDLKDKRRYLQLWARLLRIYAGTQPQYEIRLDKLKEGDKEKHHWTCGKLDFKNLNGPDEKNHMKWDIHWKQITDALADLDKNIDDKITNDGDFKDTLACLRPWIELRTAPVPYVKANATAPATNPGTPHQPDEDAVARQNEVPKLNLASLAPLMRTESAIGILKSATEPPGPEIEFLKPEEYQKIKEEPWNKYKHPSHYTLLPDNEDSLCPEEEKKKLESGGSGGCDNPPEQSGDDAITDRIGEWVRAWTKDRLRLGGMYSYEMQCDDVLDDDHIKMNRRLGHLRRLILVVVAPELPANPPYAKYFDRGRWYYIAADDEISQKNFHLLSMFLTMMAAPPQTPPLTPTISVGG